MSNPVVDAIVDQLKSGVEDAGKQIGVQALQQATDGAKSFITQAVPDIERWVTFTLSNPQILTANDLKTLLEDLAWDAIIHGLTLAGMIEVDIDKTKNTILQLVSGIATGAIAKLVV